MRKFTFRLFPLVFFLLLGTFLMGQTTYNVTFTVDMTNAEDFNPATDEVYISGSFAGWTGPGEDTNYRMKPTMDNEMIYTITVEVDSGQVQYKYFRVIDNMPSWDNGEWTGDPNRTLIIPADNLTFADIWGDKPAIVMFNVDMTNADPFDPVHDQVAISGDFAAWAMPGAFPELFLTPDNDNPNIYSVMMILYHGDYEYKFFRVIDNVPSWDNGEWEGGDNRTITVDADTVVANKVWGDINAGIFNSITNFNYEMYPNPVVNTLNISGIDDVNKIEIYDVTGKLVKQIEISTEDISIDVDQLNTGIYVISLFNDTGVQSTKFMKD